VGRSLVSLAIVATFWGSAAPNVQSEPAPPVAGLPAPLDPPMECPLVGGQTDVPSGVDSIREALGPDLAGRLLLKSAEAQRHNQAIENSLTISPSGTDSQPQFYSQDVGSTLQIVGVATSRQKIESYPFNVTTNCAGQIGFNVHERGSVLVTLETPDYRQEYLGKISVPWAVDSSGTPVKTWFETKDNTLIQVVDMIDVTGKVIFDPTFTPISCSHQRSELGAHDALNFSISDYPAWCPPVAMFWAANGWLPMWGFETNIANDYGKVLTEFPSGDACSPPSVETGIGFDFEVPCRMHDYCYSLRRAGLSGTISDAACDSAFYDAMEAHCNNRSFPLWIDCQQKRDIYYAGVRIPGVVTYPSPGLITLRNINSLQCADVPGSSMSQGTVLTQWNCAWTPNQQYRIWPVGGSPGYFEIQASHSGLCATSGLSGISQWPCGTSAVNRHVWLWSFNNSDLWTIRTRDSGLAECWDIPGSSTTLGTIISHWGCASTPNQLWQIRL